MNHILNLTYNLGSGEDFSAASLRDGSVNPLINVNSYGWKPDWDLNVLLKV